MMCDLLQKVRSILFREWDPIGVGNNQNLADEYDSYARKIVRLLKKESIAEVELYQVLKKFEDNDIGISIEDATRLHVVKRILILKDTLGETQ